MTEISPQRGLNKQRDVEVRGIEKFKGEFKTLLNSGAQTMVLGLSPSSGSASLHAGLVLTFHMVPRWLHHVWSHLHGNKWRAWLSIVLRGFGLGPVIILKMIWLAELSHMQSPLAPGVQSDSKSDWMLRAWSPKGKACYPSGVNGPQRLCMSTSMQWDGKGPLEILDLGNVAFLI